MADGLISRSKNDLALLRSWSCSSLALPTKQIDLKWHIFVRKGVPTPPPQLFPGNLNDGYALPGEPLGGPRDAHAADGGDGCEPGEEEQARFGKGANLYRRSLLHTEPVRGIRGLNHVGIASGHDAYGISIRTGISGMNYPVGFKAEGKEASPRLPLPGLNSYVNSRAVAFF